MGIARQLCELQDVDLELDSSEQALEKVEAKIGPSPVVARTRQELAREEKGLEEPRRQQREAEWQADDYQVKLAAVEEKLYSGRITNPKELTGLQHEADMIRGQRSRAEDRALELMEQVSQGEVKVAALGAALQKLEEEWHQEQEKLLAEAERYRKIIAGLKEKRQRVASSIDPSTVVVYDGIKRQKGWAVARVERGTCRSCGITLSTAQLQQARSDQLLRCSNCGRVLFHA